MLAVKLQWCSHLRTLRNCISTESLHDLTCSHALVQELLGSPNLATYFGLKQVDTIHMPLPLNIILLGFQVSLTKQACTSSPQTQLLHTVAEGWRPCCRCCPSGKDKLGVHGPVHTQVVCTGLPFLSMQGDGNMGLTLTTAEIQEWFAHADHVLPHARVDMAELSCAEDGEV